MLNYLLALGTLRATHRHGIAARMWYDSGEYHVSQAVHPDAYRPPAICCPWNGRWSTGGKAISRRDLITSSTDPRLSSLRETVRRCQEIGDYDKPQLIRRLRAECSDEAVEWIDACWTIGDDGEITPIWLCGTGGNWGSQCLGATAMQAAVAHVAGGRETFTLRPYAGDSELPAMACLIALEGLIMLAPSSTRRMRVGDNTQPMRSEDCVSDLVVGRDRLIGCWWLPEWDQPASYGEVRQMLGEHCGWTSDTQAITDVVSGRSPAGITGYRRWAIVENSRVIRGFTP